MRQLATLVCSAVRERRTKGESLRELVKQEILAILRGASTPAPDGAKPHVTLIVGVNGTGKTTTIGKIAWHLSQEFGLSVVMGAGDTYRAAAAEQLAAWADRAGAELVRGQAGADPGSVAYDAVSAAVANLPAGTAVHYRLVAQSDFATLAGPDQVLVTAAGPEDIPEGLRGRRFDVADGTVTPVG